MIGCNMLHRLNQKQKEIISRYKKGNPIEKAAAKHILTYGCDIFEVPTSYAYIINHDKKYSEKQGLKMLLKYYKDIQDYLYDEKTPSLQPHLLYYQAVGISANDLIEVLEEGE